MRQLSGQHNIERELLWAAPALVYGEQQEWQSAGTALK